MLRLRTINLTRRSGPKSDIKGQNLHKKYKMVVLNIAFAIDEGTLSKLPNKMWSPK